EIALSSLGEIPPLSNEWLISTWKFVTTLDFSKNSLRYLDESLKLFCKAESLDLSFNLLETTVDHVQHLHFLQNLNLSNNRLQDVADFYQRVGNIRSLDLSYNEITSTEGLSRLYSLITLNLNNNKLDSVRSIESLGSLPCLENLSLKNNSLTRIVDYRIRVFAVFRDRAKDVWLDGQMPDQREIDRAMIISAMTRAKQNEAAKNDQILEIIRSKTIEHNRENENDFTPLEFSFHPDTTSMKNSTATTGEEKNMLSQSKPDVLMDVITDHTSSIEHQTLCKRTESFDDDLPPNIFIDQITTTLPDLTNDAS
ncbi:unnamed protein product, partial [Didymodactylos carnosus]